MRVPIYERFMTESSLLIFIMSFDLSYENYKLSNYTFFKMYDHFRHL